jgi:hypothetical protein
MLQLHTFCRQVLYWTLAFIVLGIGWYMNNATSNTKLSAFGFGIILLLSIGLSSVVYFYHQVAISRLSSFIAVFWESRTPGVDLTWHRYNRRGYAHIQEGKPQTWQRIGMTLSARMTFKAASYAVFFIMLVLGWDGEKNDSWYIFGLGMLFLFISVLVLLTYLNKTLNDSRAQYEEGWKRIKFSGAEQVKIYDWYESPPL